MLFVFFLFLGLIYILKKKLVGETGIGIEIMKEHEY
jgi:hypothetical protein